MARKVKGLAALPKDNNCQGSTEKAAPVGLAVDKNQRYRSAQDAGNDLEQKYLYAAGFGPTNNSLAAYMKIFETGWKIVSVDQLRQLAFLKGKDGRPETKRALALADYTKSGWDWIVQRKGTALYSALATLQAMQKA